MRDPLDPTAEELKLWCSDPNAREPAEDWDLIITHEDNVDTILQLAGDTSRPQWRFFLGCLYLLVGDAVRTNYSAFPRMLIERLIKSVTADASTELKHWKTRSTDLMEGRTTFDYKNWCGRGYAESSNVAG